MPSKSKKVSGTSDSLRAKETWEKVFRPSCFGDAYKWGQCHASVAMGQRKECHYSEACYNDIVRKERNRWKGVDET